MGGGALPLMAIRTASSGQRDRYIAIQRVSETKGDASEPIESWTVLDPIYAWAKMESVDAPERFTEGMVMNQMSARSWTKFTVPYQPEIDPLTVDVPKSCRVLYENRTYDIAAANETFDEGRRRHIALLTLSKAG